MPLKVNQQLGKGELKTGLLFIVSSSHYIILILALLWSAFHFRTSCHAINELLVLYLPLFHEWLKTILFDHSLVCQLGSASEFLEKVLFKYAPTFTITVTIFSILIWSIFIIVAMNSMPVSEVLPLTRPFTDHLYLGFVPRLCVTQVSPKLGFFPLVEPAPMVTGL